MPIQLALEDATGFLTFPAGTAITGGGSTVVETHGAISEMTDAALAAKFTTADGAQPDDLIWVGTDPDNYVQWRMRQGSTNAQLTASWEEAKLAEPAETVETLGQVEAITNTALAAKFAAADDAQPDDLIWLATPATSTLYQMNAGATDARLPASWSESTPTTVASSGSLNGGIVQSPLRDRPELAALTGFQNTEETYLVQQTAGDDSSWAIGRFAQFGTTLDDLFFRPAGFELTVDTVVLVEDSQEYFLVTPAGARTVSTVHPDINALTDTQLSGVFTTADAATPGSLINVRTAADQTRYRMAQGATDARLASSWERAPLGADIQYVAAVGNLLEVDAFPSAGINGVIQDPLRSRPEIVALTAENPWTPAGAPYLVRDAADVWHIGRFELAFPNFGLDGVLFRPAGYEVNQRTLVWNEGESQLWLLEPVDEGGQAYITGGGAPGTGTVTVDAAYSASSTSTNPLTHGAIANKFNALVTVSEAEPNVSESEWIVWVQRSADGRFIEAFLRVTPGQYMTIEKITSPTPIA